MYGGFVRWEAGTKADGTDSRAIPIANEDHWPELEMLVLVASAEKKKVSSTTGMQTSVATSALLNYRASSVVPERLKRMEEAYKKRDFETFGKITMQDSNQFHATCLDTYPPIFYLNEVSHRIINLVHAFNSYHGAVKAAYTFDAGPNAVVFMEKENIASFLALARHVFPTDDQSYINDAVLRAVSDKVVLPSGMIEAAENWVGVQRQGLITRILHTTVGQGPQELPQVRRVV
jgi:diphosphomevalonate decarboxylase